MPFQPPQPPPSAEILVEKPWGLVSFLSCVPFWKPRSHLVFNQLFKTLQLHEVFFIYSVFPQCWFRSGPPRRIGKSWLFHNGIVVSVSTLPVHRVIWGHLGLRIKCLLHTVVAVEGWGELSSISLMLLSEVRLWWQRAWCWWPSHPSHLETQETEGLADDSLALSLSWPLTLSPGNTCEGTGGYYFSLSYFKGQFVFYNKK